MFCRALSSCHPLFLLLPCVLSLLTFCAYLPAESVDGDPYLPSKELLRQRLDSLQGKELLPEEKELQIQLRQTLYFLEQIEEANNELETYTSELESVDSEKQKLQKQVDRFRETEDLTILKKFHNKDLPTLEATYHELESEQAALQEQLAKTNGRLSQEQSRPEASQEHLDTNKKREALLKAKLKELTSAAGSDQLSEARQDNISAELAFLTRSDVLLQQQARGSSTLIAKFLVQRDLVHKQLQQSTRELQVVQGLINRKRKAASEAVLSMFTKESESGENPAIKESVADNIQLSLDLLQVTDYLTEIGTELRQATSQLTILQDIQHSLTLDISPLSNMPDLAAMLQEQKAALPKIRVNPKIREIISRYQLKQFSYTNELRNISASGYQQKWLQELDYSGQLSKEEQARLKQLFDARKKVLTGLVANIGNLLSQATTLKAKQDQLMSNRQSLEKLLNQRLFWLASNRPLSLSQTAHLFPTIKEATGQLYQSFQAADVMMRLKEQRKLLVGVALVICYLLWRKRKWQLIERKLGSCAGNVIRDNYYVTPYALLISALQVLPLPLVIYTLGRTLEQTAADAMPLELLGDNLSAVGVVWFISLFGRHLLQPNGLVKKHFSWAPDNPEKLRQLARYLHYVLISLTFLLIWPDDWQVDADQSARMILFAVLLLCQSAIAASIVLQPWARKYSRPVLGALLFAAVILPLGMMVLVTLGYFYTATLLEFELISAFLLVFCWALLRGIILRIMHVAAERLALKRYRERLAALHDDSVEPVLVERMDMSQVEEQSLRLVNAAMIVLFCVMFYLFWQDMIEQFTYQDHYVLWQYAADAGNERINVDIMTLLSALFVTVATVLLVRNIPGLLEVTLLNRLSYSPGSGFALTRISVYLIASIGTAIVLSMLGVSWSKLQWLVAAMGLGISFGLQEVFANFFSGLVILFERPVRLGDTITVAGETGSVQKIQMRATTIQDWDRKEIIIPNKILITEKLVNWSLSNSVIRVLVHVAVPHHVDPEHVRKVLLQIINARGHVLSDPEPAVFLMNQSLDAQEFELQVYVAQTSERLLVRDALNREIYRKFSEQNIPLARSIADIRVEMSKKH
ncbi:mechanosensitive ion channel domain-containing protein [Endozoicomonadaceae bacterium StTr2]